MRRNRAYSILAWLLLIIAPLSAQQVETETHYRDLAGVPREHPVDVERMRLEVSFDAPKGLVKGRVTHVFKPLREKVESIYFDGVNMTIREALLNGKPVNYTTSNEGITVIPDPPLKWNSRDSITLVYEVYPRKGIYFIGWNDPANLMRKQIWTQGQDTDNRYWIPMYDAMNDKMITETVVTFDKKYPVISNGTKIYEKENRDGTKTWGYRLSRPHASYLVMLAAGDYKVKNTKSKSGLPIQLWYYPDQADRMEYTYNYTARAVDFLEGAIGIPFPWESLANIPAQNFVTGAMENTSAIIFGDFWYYDSRGYLDGDYVDTDVHEIAHQWWGDMITARNNKHLWLQESFATYYAKTGCRKFFGEDYYQWTRRKEHTQSLNAEEKNRLPIVHNDAGYRIYPKGSAVIDMMNYVFGEEAYHRAAYYFLTHHRYQNVETNDLYQSFQDTLGLSPDWFFDEWLYRGGIPHYEVSYQDAVVNNHRETQITVSQIHPVDELVRLFKMPIVFEVHYADGTKDSLREMIDQQTQKVVIPNEKNKNLSYVLFDPGSVILKNVTFNKSYEELKAQALQAANMIDRYDAVVGLREYDVSRKRDVLIDVFGKEKFHAVKDEVVSQLVNDSDRTGLKFIQRALKDPSADVRKAAITNVQGIPQSLLPDFEALLTDSSYDAVFSSLLKLTDQFPQNTERYLDLVKNTDGNSCRIKIKALEIAASRGDQKAMKALVAYSSPSYEFGTRRHAFSALKRLNHLDESVIANLFEAMLNPQGALSAAAQEVGEYFYEQTALKNKIKTHYHSHAWEDWQKEILTTVVK